MTTEQLNNILLQCLSDTALNTLDTDDGKQQLAGYIFAIADIYTEAKNVNKENKQCEHIV